MTIVEFLEARLDEDEQAARSAAGERWTETSRLARHPDDWRGCVAAYREGVPTGAQLIHIDRHDPDRVLREVEAKRRTLARHAPYHLWNGACVGCGFESGDGGTYATEDIDQCPELRDLAAVYADHPDYDETWRPQG